MRGVSRWASRVAPLLAALLVLGAAGAWADEAPTPPTDPPQARLGPPVGVTSEARMKPPDGLTAHAPMTFAQMFLLWLESRLTIPHG
jgi:hypothetical protein